MPKPKPYHGRVRIECQSNKACPRKVVKDVLAECLDCPGAKITVLGLEGETLSTLTNSKSKPKKGAQHGR